MLSQVSESRPVHPADSVCGFPTQQFWGALHDWRRRAAIRGLVDGAFREIVALRLEVERAKGLLILGEVLAQYIP